MLGGESENERGVFIIYFRTEYWQSSNHNGSFLKPEMKKFKIMLLQHRMFLFGRNGDIQVFQKCHSGKYISPNSTLPLIAYLVGGHSTSLIKCNCWYLILLCLSSLWVIYNLK